VTKHITVNNVIGVSLEGSKTVHQLSSNAFFIVLQKVSTVPQTRPTSCATILFLPLKQMIQQAAKKKEQEILFL
jgi:hypothetical protein